MSLITIWLKKLASRLLAKFTRRRRSLYPRKWRRNFLIIEHLEERLAPATYFWAGGTSANWSPAANWSATQGGPGGAGTPSSPGDVANFAGLTSPTSVTLDQ